MKLKSFFTLIVAFAGLFFVACNSDNEYTYGEASSDGQILTFSVDAAPYTANDSITYPALSTTKFTVQNNNGEHLIFNRDSLPMGLDVRSMMLTMSYTSVEPAKVELVYPKDSIPSEWNIEDSVKFMKKGDIYYPFLRLTSQSGKIRDYKIEFRIHQQDPDSIRWFDMNKENGFILPALGESKVLQDVDNNLFQAFIKREGIVNFYTSVIGSYGWSAPKNTGLPSNIFVKSICRSSGVMAAIDVDGNTYTSATNDGGTWKKATLTNIVALLGELPEIDAKEPKGEMLVIYRDQADGKLKYGKTSNFETLSVLKVSTRGENNEVLPGFPVKEFSSVLQTIEEDQSLMVTGGYTESGSLVKKTWRISNRVLGDDVAKGEISIIPGMTAGAFPTNDNVTSFAYADKLYAMSVDSLSLYHSIDGDNWTLANEKTKLDEKMVDLGKSSVLVDKENYIWVFGGVSKEGDYSQQIWRGRLNKLTFKE